MVGCLCTDGIDVERTIMLQAYTIVVRRAVWSIRHTWGDDSALGQRRAPPLWITPEDTAPPRADVRGNANVPVAARGCTGAPPTFAAPLSPALVRGRANVCVPLCSARGTRYAITLPRGRRLAGVAIVLVRGAAASSRGASDVPATAFAVAMGRART